MRDQAAGAHRRCRICMVRHAYRRCARAGVPGQGDPLHRRLLGQQRGRFSGAHHRPEDDRDLGPAGERRAKPGAGSIIATELVAKAAPDGHTIVIVPASYTLNPSLYRKLPYDSLRDLAPVTLVGTQPTLLVMHPSVPVRT